MRLVAEGGYQPFQLHSTEWIWLIFAAACGLVAIITGFILMRGVLAADQGTLSPSIEIAKAIQEGAQAYLIRQFRAIGTIGQCRWRFWWGSPRLAKVTQTLPLTVASTRPFSYGLSGLLRAPRRSSSARQLSGLAGYIGMSTAVRGNRPALPPRPARGLWRPG